MAQISNEHCHVCDKTTPHVNRRCSPCYMRLEKERIDTWNNQELDVKLDELRQRIEKLECGPIRYA